MNIEIKVNRDSRKLIVLPITYLSVILICFFVCEQAFAQLSPGDLNRVHADLEGIANCEKCHEARKQISSAKCLDCHKILKERIDSGKGLHSNANYRDCTSCHVEHLGRESQLVWWPDGIANFDHSLTGYKLQGKHAGLDCRKCHEEKNIKHQITLLKAGKDLKTTFLGLEQKCLNCHKDEHRGQLGEDCLKCHEMHGWKPVTGFDHSKTSFALSGKHLDVDCVKCHTRIVDKNDPEVSFLKLTGIKHDGCVDCHKDIHAGKFSQVCATCHNTSGWKNVNRSEFDHSKTRYPLQGKHALLACEKCHEKGKPLTGLQYGKCTDCHPDFHRGAFAARVSGGECSECHSVNGFAPSSFSIEDHQKTKYPLEGSHLAIPCELCHKTEYENNGSKIITFKFKSTECESCHNNPHGKSVDKYMVSKGCPNCHNVSGWKHVSFDHNSSGFALEGRHLKITCTECHKPKSGDQGKMDLIFTGLSKTCYTCHTDIHRGQFAEKMVMETGEVSVTRCERCHTSANWLPDKFDHNRDSRFKLEGAHKKVTCNGCHMKIEEPGGTFVRFKPLNMACKDCHGSADLKLNNHEEN